MLIALCRSTISRSALKPLAQHVQTGLPCWGSELIPAEERDYEGQKLDGLKAFLEGLQAFNTPGKLKNLSKSVLEIPE
jgi:hypothetical protein